MDMQSGRYVFGFDSYQPIETEGLEAATLERSRGRRRNPANGFRELPAPTGPYPFHLDLAAVLGPAAMNEITGAGKLVFHAIGDSGQKSNGGEAQEGVAELMGAQATLALGANRARFLYHLGDVVYFDGDLRSYESQFYEPYKNYAAPIFAIPGNHDVAVPHGNDPLQGFMENFCSAQPVHHALAGESSRTTMTQPHCYWTLLTPYARIIGLNSNVPGRLDNHTTRQLDWLTDELRGANDGKAIIVAVHHCPYSRDSSHGGYRAIEGVLDRAFRDSGVTPHLVLNGHVHNYQRFERDLTEFGVARKLSYVVAGAGGFAGFNNLHEVDESDRLPAGVEAITHVDDLPGFLQLEISATEIRGRYYAVPRPPQHRQGPAVLKDEFRIPVATAVEHAAGHASSETTNRFGRVLEILDNAVGGPDAPVGAHGAFWRGLSRDQFVSKKIFGLGLVVVGSAANSNLVKALAGTAPFGADLPDPPPGATFSRMPSALDPVSAEDQQFIRQWIDDGCPDDESAAAGGAVESVAPQALPPATRSVAALLEDATTQPPTLEWLKEALQLAVQLELYTLPPYLTARWTIKNFGTDPVSKSIKEIRGEEMLHFGLAANLLVAIGGTPRIANAEAVPQYPGHLPGNVRPELTVKLARLSAEQVKTFMEVEYPQGGPIALEAITYNSIGEFYGAIRKAFELLNPPIDKSRQLDGPLGLFKIENLDQVKAAIDLISLQGEGTTGSPEEQSGDLAHYYRFGEIASGKRLVKNPATGQWSYSGADVPLPETWPMADVPPGGYLPADVPEAAVWNLVTTFDQQYSDMLRELELAWQHGDDQYLSSAVGLMIQMGSTGRQLVQKPKPDGAGNYGPCFRFVP